MLMPCSRSESPAPSRIVKALRWGAGLIAAALLTMTPPVLADETRDEAADISVSTDASFSTEDSRLANPQASYSQEPGTGGKYKVTASFRDFNREALSIRFNLDLAASRASLREFGVSNDELDALLRECMASKDCDQQEFDRWTSRYYRDHALRMKDEAGQGSKLYVDVAEVVRRNRGRVKPVAAALRKLASERGQNHEWTVEAAVSMVQTGLVYRQPKAAESGRRILGFYPPPLALERGYGDCDTKSALLAAILQNLSETPIIGVHVPRHYLLGVAGTPRAGQSSISYRGQSYVLIEAAGPGQRRPGQVAKATQLALKQGQGIRVDPMF